MRRRNQGIFGGNGTGLGDLMMNCLMAILILMFIFMVNQGVKAIVSRVDEEQLTELMELQQQAIEEAGQHVQAVIDGQEQTRKKHREEKKALLTEKENAEAAAQQARQDGKDRERHLQDKIKQLRGKITKAREARSLRVDISHDFTGSMGNVAESTKATMAALTRTAPIVLTEVEIGMIGYRNEKLAKLPIEAVRNPAEDGGASIRRINERVEKFEASGGIANTEQAIRASMERFDAMSGSPQECLVVIGDIGTSEVSQGQAAVATQLLSDVKAWCASPGKDRCVLAIYTGTGGTEDEAFFRSLGKVNEKSMFSTKYEQLFELVLGAAFSTREKQP